MKVTNNEPGPRGVWAGGVLLMLDPGQTEDVRFGDGEQARAKATEWFSFGKPDLDDMDDETLRAFLAQHKVEADGRWGRDKLLDAAKKVKV